MSAQVLAARRARMRARMVAEGATCTILRDPPGVDDDVIDDVTLALLRPVGDLTEVYTGPCWVLKPEFISDRNSDYGGGRDDERMAQVLQLPGDAPPPVKDDVVRITACPSDPTLVYDVVNRAPEFKVDRVTRGDFLVTRKVTVTET